MKPATKSGLALAVVLGMSIVTVAVATLDNLKDQTVFGVPGAVVTAMLFALAAGIMGGALIRAYASR